MSAKMRYSSVLSVLLASWLLTPGAAAAETCGDGVFDESIEECDDGNREPGDGCDELCAVECTEIGRALTEHTCLHGSNGPFASVGSAGEGELPTSAVSTPHTYYTVTLRGDPGQNLSRVIYQPSADGIYAVYTNKPYPLRLLNEEEEEVEVILEHSISSCAVRDSLTWVRAFQALDDDRTYVLELGPHEDITLSLAFEYVGAGTPLYRDADLDGHATRTPVAIAWCEPPPGYANRPGFDCDDNDSASFPGALELCDGKNTDCDGQTDDREPELCSESELGFVCGSFHETTRCGCETDDDCREGTVCDADGQCQNSSPGSGGQGGGSSIDPGSGGSWSSGDAGAGSDNEPSGGRSGVGGKSSGELGSGGTKGSPDDDDRDDEDPTSGGGCSCSVPSQRPTGPGWLLLAAPVFWLQRRRAWRRPRSSRAPYAALLTLLSALGWSGQARAELPPDCEGLGKALTEHSCFHSTLGPFEFREATPGDTATERTPNVNPVHTEYRVLLTPGPSSLTYRPERGGSFTVFTGRDVPLTIHREGEAPRSVVFETTETDCEALPLARVYDLVERVTYTLTFESEDASDVALVIEYVDDFLIQNGIDRDGDGYGDPLETVRSVCVPPAGYAPNTSDCDDTDPTVHPGATELCGDSVDQNCNGLLDDTALGCRTGLGVCATQGVSACGEEGQVFCFAEGASPSDEICNGKDDDCDGFIDEGSALCQDASRPRCVRSGFTANCGCQFDSDCEGGTRVCTCATPHSGHASLENRRLVARREPVVPEARPRAVKLREATKARAANKPPAAPGAKRQGPAAALESHKMREARDVAAARALVFPRHPGSRSYCSARFCSGKADGSESRAEAPPREVAHEKTIFLSFLSWRPSLLCGAQLRGPDRG